MVYAVKNKGQQTKAFLRVLKYSTGGVLEVNSILLVLFWIKIKILELLGKKKVLFSCFHFVFSLFYYRVFTFILGWILSAWVLRVDWPISRLVQFHLPSLAFCVLIMLRGFHLHRTWG